jgi:choline dehydrogenase-like flavoprotein
MIQDLRMLEDGMQFTADVCLVGAGAAGIALALELTDTNLSIILLESGGLEPKESDQNLNDGDIAGLLYRGLKHGRARSLGGATKLWFGQCIRFDPIDFEKRPWVPHSGWPITAKDLDEWYQRAERMFNIQGERYDEGVYKKMRTPAPSWNKDRIRTHFTIYSPKVDLGALYGGRLGRSTRVQVLLHANVTEIQTDENSRKAEAVHVRTLAGGRAQIRANAIVLCGGGIENARLLLLSTHFNPKGLGNDHDLVGRFLQDHPNGFTATLETTDTRALSDLFALQYQGPLRYFPKFPLGFATQRTEQALNCTSHLVFDYAEESGIASLKEIYRSLRRRKLPPNLMTQLKRIALHLPEVARATSRRYFLGKSPLGNPRRILLQCHTEQQPDPDSRVTLSPNRDALGLFRGKVDWRLNHSERHSVQVMTTAMGGELKRLGLAQLKPEPWLDEPGEDWKSKLSDCFHHIGTTRMSDSPTTGVVDRNCEVFGVRRLYIAGSSVFPTSGYANPTLTIVAMAMRLASHLKAELRS